jgi:serine/threonine-protein kinase 24/25/MST4
MPPVPVEQSPDYDRVLQEQLQRDIGHMHLGTAIQPTHPSQSLQSAPILRPQGSNSRLGVLSLPEIPPFRGGQSTPTQQRLPHQSSQTQLRQPSGQIPPPTPPKAQHPPLLSKTQLPHHPSSSSSSLAESSTNPSSFPAPAPSNPNGELDALNDVIFPALEEALKRRQIRLQAFSRAEQQTYSAPTAKQQRAEAAHEKLRRLVYKLAHVCKEIDGYDKAEPVGMGRDVGTFLEGLLEEILVRVEPFDEMEG